MPEIIKLLGLYSEHPGPLEELHWGSFSENEIFKELKLKPVEYV